MSAKDSSRTILLVEHDVLVRNFIRRSLEEANFSVLSAVDATEALALSRAWSGRIHVLLADTEIDDMDVVVLADQVAESRKDTAILVMSAGTSQSLPPALPFINKPFTATSLVRSIRGLLESFDESFFSQSTVAIREIS